MATTREISLRSLRLGGGNPLFLIAGPCVIESEAHTRKMAECVSRIATDAGVPYIFKASYDKANRSSRASFRGLGIESGLRVLEDVRRTIGVAVLTDVHEDTQGSSSAPGPTITPKLVVPRAMPARGNESRRL